MSDDKNSGVDPRFDPAFQRGFDPATPIEESVPAPVARRVAAAPVSSAPATPARVLPAAPPSATATASPAASSPARPSIFAPPAGGLIQALPDVSGQESAEGLATGVTTGVVTESGSEVPPSRNPFLLFIVVIAVALIAVGIWLFVRSGQAFNSSEVRSQGDYMSLDATIHTAPFIALLGGAAAIGVLFVFAARYRRRQ